MPGITIEQAVFRREGAQPPQLQGRSAGFVDPWLAEAERIIEGFGERPVGIRCPLALFVQPLGKKHVAVVQVADRPAAGNGEAPLAFRFLALARRDYESQLGDPFVLADRLPPDWERPGALPNLEWTDVPLPGRTVPQIQAVLKRVKAGALKEGEDPEAASFERTDDNSESPALLGGTQVLVDGGRLVLERKSPDNDFLRGLWTLLPNRTRGRVYPASFAFSNDLDFDVVVVPRLNMVGDLEGYLTEDMACDYPASNYEFALQQAAEAGDQASLDSLLNRRDSRETLRLAFFLLVGMIVLVVVMNLFFPARRSAPLTSEERVTRLAASAAIVAVQDPWTIVALTLHGDEIVEKQNKAAGRD